MNSSIEGIEFCLNSTLFIYHNNFLSQIFSTLMGSPISATTSNQLWKKLEPTVIDELKYKPHCLLCIPKTWTYLEYSTISTREFSSKTTLLTYEKHTITLEKYSPIRPPPKYI